MISKEMHQILSDFIKDILLTFPEYENNLHPGLYALHHKEKNDAAIEEVIEHCKKVYPERFFDILYQKDAIFEQGPLYFLPQIDFCVLWKLDISDNTRTIIWKYLQLLLFTLVNKQTNSETFGDTAKLFEAIDETEFKNKLEETIAQMTEIFNISGDKIGADIPGTMPMPDVNHLQENINSMLEGNLGNLAREIAEETAEELTEGLEDVTTVGDVFKKLFRNPGKLMSLVKKVGSKLDAKLKSGEMKESELIKEASELITKMNKMPGMKEMNQMLGQMGLPTNNKMNMGAFQAHMAQNMKAATTRERLQRKLEMRRAAAAAVAAMQKDGLPGNQGNNKSSNPKRKKKRRKKRKNKK